MPFVSDAQRRWGHTKKGMEALGGPSKVAEWDSATKGKKLPERKMEKGGLVPGKVVNPAKPVDMKGIVKGKSENLAGTPRSGAIDPASNPGAKRFKSVTNVRDYPKER